MYQKDLRLYSTSRPQLVVYYTGACSKVFAVKMYIPEKLFPKFEVFETDLRELAISPKDYAYTIVATMLGFVREKGWKCLPINLFLSDYCLNRYRKMEKYKTVDIKPVDDKDVIFHDELLVARLFIDMNIKSNDGYHRMTEIVDELKPLLSKEWLQVYSSKKRRPEIEVIDQLCEEYRIPAPMQSYLDIVSALR